MKKIVRVLMLALPVVLVVAGEALAAAVTNQKLDGALTNALDTVQRYGPMLAGVGAASGYAAQHLATDASTKEKINQWIKGSLYGAAGTAAAPEMVKVITGLFQ